MATVQDLEVAYQELSDSWDRAEKYIKIAEQINSEVVIPSIYELRYAGRKIIDAKKYEVSNMEEALKQIEDAKWDCLRAAHDAVDASVSAISVKINLAIDKIGANSLLAHYPEFSILYKNVIKVHEKIVVSRENRHNRDNVYETLSSVDLKTLKAQYDDFISSEDLMIKAAEEEQRQTVRGEKFQKILIIIAIVSVFISIVSVFT